VVLESDGEAVPAILELREGDDGVQVETARTMVCGDRSFASCRHVERRLEIRATAVLCRARRRTTSTGRSGRRRSYQGVQDLKTCLSTT
jgi:hypothetical protein